MLTRHGTEGECLDPHAQLGGAQVFFRRDLGQVRGRYAKPVRKPLGGSAPAVLDKEFKFHARSLVSNKPSCQAFACSAGTKHTDGVDITEIRRERLKAWFAKIKIPAEEKSYLSQLMGGKASFGEKAARRLERSYKMPPMYLDTPLDEVLAPISSGHAELLEVWDWLLPGEKDEVLANIRPIAARNKEAANHFRIVKVVDRRKRQVNFDGEDLRQSKEESDA